MLAQDNTPLIEIKEGSIYFKPDKEDIIDTAETCHF